METVLIGYLARCTPPKPRSIPLPPVDEVCCVAPDIIYLPDLLRLENWHHQKRHNRVNHFDSEQLAWTVLQDDIHIQLERDDSLGIHRGEQKSRAGLWRSSTSTRSRSSPFTLCRRNRKPLRCRNFMLRQSRLITSDSATTRWAGTITGLSGVRHWSATAKPSITG